jgi:hypothetical protein
MEAKVKNTDEPSKWVASFRRKTCLNLVFPWFLAEMLLEDRKLPEGFLREIRRFRSFDQGIFEEPTDANRLRSPASPRLPGRR